MPEGGTIILTHSTFIPGDLLPLFRYQFDPASRSRRFGFCNKPHFVVKHLPLACRRSRQTCAKPGRARRERVYFLKINILRKHVVILRCARPRSLTRALYRPCKPYRSKIPIGVATDFDYVCSTMPPRKSAVRVDSNRTKLEQRADTPPTSGRGFIAGKGLTLSREMDSFESARVLSPRERRP